MHGRSTLALLTAVMLAGAVAVAPASARNGALVDGRVAGAMGAAAGSAAASGPRPPPRYYYGGSSPRKGYRQFPRAHYYNPQPVPPPPLCGYRPYPPCY